MSTHKITPAKHYARSIVIAQVCVTLSIFMHIDFFLVLFIVIKLLSGVTR